MSEFFTHVDGEFLKLQDIDSCLNLANKNIKYLFDSQTNQIDYLKKRVEELEDEKFHDKEIEKLQAEIEQLKNKISNGFIISEKDSKTIEDWKMKHLKKKHWDKKRDCCKSFGAIGGNFTYEFIPTSIGDIITCKCSCGEEITINDL